MAHNNDAFYDAVVAGAGGGAQHGWLILSTPASYTPFAANIDILATAVDLQIPAIAGGASISQINLLQSITQSVLTARYPVPVAPATYIDIAKAIAAVYTELEKLLTNQPTVASYGVNWLVTDWYIDGTVGDDANSGVVIGAPIKTGAELLRRLGSYAMWPQSVTVHVLANGMIDALVLRGLMMVAGTHLDIVGTPTVLRSDTLATYTAQNHATATAAQITATTVADFAPYQWLRCRITAGVRTGTIWWIAVANPAGAGINIARITRPVNIDPVATGDMYVNVVPVAADPFNVESLPNVPAIILDIDGATGMAAASQFAQRQFQIRDIGTPTFNLIATGVTERVKGSIFGMKLANWNQDCPQPAGLSVTIFRGCSIYSIDPAQGGFARQCGQFMNCLFGQGMTSFAFNQVSYCSDGLFQGAAVSSSLYLQFLNCQIFDTAGAATVAFSPLVGTSNNLSGSGNAGYGIGLINTTVWRFLGTTNLLAAVSNGRLIAAPATSLTLPQFLQTSDYAQKGITPAMVAGTTTVTVPWYDNATQQVTVSHAAFAGTPGILSVQQISTTQFVITSSSALDTSTVRWQISPLGRNIFISTL